MGDPVRISWDALARGGADRADGRPVEIDGYLCPFEPAEAASYLTLVAEPPCCAGCLPQDPALRIELFASASMSVGAGPVRVAGTLRVLDDDPAGWRYQLRDARKVATGFSRRHLLVRAPLVCAGLAAGTSTGCAQSAVSEAAAREAIADMPTADVHSHAGALIGVRRVREHAPFTPLAAPMREGGMAVVCLAVVSDSPTHHVVDGRIHPFRDPAPGELYAYTNEGFARLHALVAAQSLRVLTTAAGLDAARGNAPSVVVASEGGDFLEGRPDRVDEAYERWQLRHLQLTHYRPNELGDIQTEPPVHGGLTDAGADVVRRCNRRGVVVDVAHGTFDLVKRAATVTTKPLVLSHTSLSGDPAPRSRLISPDHARAIAGTGGVIGIWPPRSRFPDLDALAAGMAAMVDVAGIDHVALGTDMGGLVGPSVFTGYDDLPALSRALLARGFTREDVRKLLGLNYRRVFAACMVAG